MDVPATNASSWAAPPNAFCAVHRVQSSSSESAPSSAVSGDDAIFALRLVEVAPADFERLYGEIATFMDGPGAAIPGLLETELFGSIARRLIQVLAKFRSHADWTHAQWDGRLGDLLGDILATSQTLDFDLYHGDRFPSKPLAQPITQSPLGRDHPLVNAAN